MQTATMLQRLPEYTRRWRNGEIADAAYACVYFLLWQIERHGARFASRRSKNDPRPDPSCWLAILEAGTGDDLSRTLQYWFARYQFLGIIPNVPTALYHWLCEAWPLQLLERIPSPAEVLEMQTAGTRPVTVLSAFPRLLRPVLSKPNAFAFMVHDLEHAYKFMHEPDLWKHQMAFFGKLKTCLHEGWFAGYVEDPLFSEKFDYLISDMNTHPVHGLQYLQAILVDFHLRSEEKPPSGKVSPDTWIRISRIVDTLAPTAWGGTGNQLPHAAAQETASFKEAASPI